MHAKHPEIAKQWELHTPPGKLPKKVTKVKEAYDEGIAAALEHFGLKEAAEEIRLKIPKREFHGFDAAFKARNGRPLKQANVEPLEPQASEEQPAEMLAALLQSLPVHRGPNESNAKIDDVNRPVGWSSSMDISRGAV